jgi:FkbM family methyltransferase
MRLRATCSLLSLLSLLVACASEPPAAASAPVAPPAPIAQPADVAAQAPAATPPAAPAAPADGARPALNADLRNPDMDVASWVERFEGESREIAAHRDAIAAVLALQPGEAVADIGAGTGLFEEPFAKAVGPTGKVFAVDLSPAFLEHLRRRAAEQGLKQVEVVACDDRDTRLPAASVDAAFLCDTYHHFEHPADTLASLLRALRPGGRLVVVDFEREPGKSRDWILDHVRCGKQQVRAEIERAGFRFDGEPRVAGLAENYVLRFIAPGGR